MHRNVGETATALDLGLPATKTRSNRARARLGAELLGTPDVGRVRSAG